MNCKNCGHEMKQHKEHIAKSGNRFLLCHYDQSSKSIGGLNFVDGCSCGKPITNPEPKEVNQNG